MTQYELVPSSSSSEGEGNDFVFLSESEPLETLASSANTDPDLWRVLAVDDDPDFQRSMAFALSGMCVLGRKIELLQAGSHAEAAQILAREQDIAVMLLDVVMETDDAGLRLARAVREVLGNAELRIVLVTGQPGFAPVREVMEHYDINDYWSKSDLGIERLHTLLTANARAWMQVHTIARARRGLQMIVEASNVLVGARNLNDFSARTIAEIASVLGVAPEGVVCVRRTRNEVCIIGAAGRYAGTVGKSIDSIATARVHEAISTCLREQRTLIRADCMVLYFPSSLAGSEYVAWVEIENELDATEQELLRVFAMNIGGGLHNVALFSRLDELAYSDSLLGLPNRNALLRAIEAARSGSARQDHTLLLLDVDSFAGLNLALGPAYGDSLLRRIGQQLRQRLDPTVLIARVGGDLFALLGPSHLIDPAEVRRKLADDLDAVKDGGTCTFGSAALPLARFEGNAGEALTTAMLLMRNAKRRGHGQHQDWIPSLAEEAGSRFELLNQFRDALESDGFTIELQPQVNLTTGAVVGVEALARWRRADGSRVPPDVFIGLAETTGLIQPLSERIYAQAFEAADQLAEAGFAHVHVAINVSARQFMSNGQLPKFQNHLGAKMISAKRIEVEITESTAMENYSVIRGTLESLRRCGHTVAIDDFGTGYSSLACLRNLPADLLKIDRSFVQEIGGEADQTAIADLVIRLGQRLGLNTIAEGVETPAQAGWLRARGCNLAQGWLFSRPLPLDVLIPWLEKGQGRVQV